MKPPVRSIHDPLLPGAALMILPAGMLVRWPARRARPALGSAFEGVTIDVNPEQLPTVQTLLFSEDALDLDTLAFDDPKAYQLCADYANQPCPMSSVAVIHDRGQAGSRLSDAEDSCLVTQDPPPTDTGGPYLVTIRPASRPACADDFAVQLSVNDVGQLTAVNLLLGTVE